jgi:hypothetical protein
MPWLTRSLSFADEKNHETVNRTFPRGLSLQFAEHGADEGKLNGDPETDGRPGEGPSFDQPA